MGQEETLKSKIYETNDSTIILMFETLLQDDKIGKFINVLLEVFTPMIKGIGTGSKDIWNILKSSKL